MRSHTHFKTVGLFLLLIAVLLFGASLTYRATMRISQSERLVTHTYQVMDALDSLIFTLQRSQNSANDFISTADDSYLSLYRAASDRLELDIHTVRELTRDNSQQQQAIAAIEPAALAYKSLLDAAVEARLHGPGAHVRGDRVRQIQQDVRAMKAREADLLQQRSREAAESLKTTRLGLLAGAFVNCILLAIGGYLVIRDQDQQSQIRTSRLRLASIVETSDDAIISKQLDGTIISWNSGAERHYGYQAQEMIGNSIYEIVPPEKQEELRTILEKLGRGERTEHLETRRVRKDGAQVDVEVTVSPIEDEYGKVIGASAIGRDITQRKAMERSLHQLSVRILKAQDEERRRIAREIHDTTVQKLALLSMNLSQLQNPTNVAKSLAALDSSQQLTSECIQELRTLSYVLHPPMLDELGLASALKIYVEGLSQRSGVAITTEMDPAVPRLNPEVEMALFRVAQESLSNVLRHSGSKTAQIRLKNHEGVEISIHDEGMGMPAKLRQPQAPAPVGVGILGMNERIAQLGGVLTIDSGPGGTTVTARIPVERAAIA